MMMMVVVDICRLVGALYCHQRPLGVASTTQLYRGPCGRVPYVPTGGIDADGQSVSIWIHSSCRKALHGDVSWKRQHSVMGNATQEREKE